MAIVFRDFDLVNFWEDSDYARKSYVESRPTAETIASIEKELGFHLPASYVELMQSQNGGLPRNNRYPTQERTSWSHDHIAITGIMGIGRTKIHSLCGGLGSKFMQEEWGYPDFGICVCDCPSAGHDMVMLDYRECGRNGEPRVIHVDQELDYKITPLAENFEAFIRGLVNESVYDTSAEDLKNSLLAIEQGAFSTLLTRLIAICPEADFGRVIRSACHRLATEKGYFALHADDLSYFLYDIQFYLYSKSHPVKDEQTYLKAYRDMLAFGDGEVTTGGYGPDFVKEWFRQRRAKGDLVVDSARTLVFSKAFKSAFEAKLQDFQ